MSLDSLSWAARLKPDGDVTDGALRTLSLLADHEDDGIAWPSVPTLCKIRGRSRSQILAHLAALEAAGHIERVLDSGVVDHLASNRRPIVWRLNFTPLGSGRPDVKRRGQGSGRPDVKRRGQGSGRPDVNAPWGPVHQRSGVRSTGSTPLVESVRESGGSAGVQPTGPQDVRRYPEQCGAHQTGPHHDSCPACGRARRDHAAALEEARARRARERREEQLERSRTAAAAIVACTMCDADGRTAGGAICHHVESARMPVGLLEEIRAAAGTGRADRRSA